MKGIMNKLTTCLWFDDNALDAARFYASIFKRKSKVGAIARYGPEGPGKKGSVLTVAFTLAGQDFIGLNGGPVFKFSPAISMSIDCKNQKEVDYYWSRLLKGGQASQCGWLTDKFGLSWQVVPSALPKLLQDKDPARRSRVMKAMLQMVKLDVATLKAAAKG
jgi:predicted 3-demethylubiquinone-9 3-methyltransferase (glyoxalase superfamily)